MITPILMGWRFYVMAFAWFRFVLMAAFLILGGGRVRAATNGHLTSFFLPSEVRYQDIATYTDPTNRTLVVPAALGAVERLGGNYLGFAFWDTNSRTVQSWGDFKEFLAGVQRLPNPPDVYAYLNSPSYEHTSTSNNRFTWEEVEPGGLPAVAVGEYTDYGRWATEVAALGLKFPVLKGILLDDLDYDTTLSAKVPKFYTPAYLGEIKAKALAINPAFRLEAVVYLARLASPYFAKLYSPYIDGLHCYYRHTDLNGFDTNPSRVLREGQYFHRCFSKSEACATASVFLGQRFPQKAGVAVTVQTELDYSLVTNDVEVVYFDTIGEDPRNLGDVKRIRLDEDLLLEMDLAADSASRPRSVWIPYAFVLERRAKGVARGVLTLEIAHLKPYSNWEYTVTIYVGDGYAGKLDWQAARLADGYTMTSSHDIEREPRLYLGVYAGSPSFMTVTENYCREMIYYGDELVRRGWFAGLVAWEVLMNLPDSPAFGEFQRYFADGHKLEPLPSIYFVKGVEHPWSVLLASGLPDRACILERSANLGDWVPCATNKLADGVTEFRGIDGSSESADFFRARLEKK